MTDNPRTKKYQQVRHSLPDELQPIFDTLVEDYKFATSRRYGQSFVAYIVFADLVRVGWRRTS